jgi:signal transduction histidine kinase/CheY-like chemotaxis protein
MDLAGQAQTLLSAADIRRARLIVAGLACLASVYAVIFAAAAWVIRSPRLGAVSAVALLSAALYSLVWWLIVSGRFTLGIRLFIAGVLAIVLTGTFVIPDELVTWVIAAFLPFGLALQFTSGRTPLFAAAGGLAVALNALVVRSGLHLSSGFSSDFLGWLDVAGGVIVLFALALLLIQIREMFEARAIRLIRAEQQAATDAKLAERRLHQAQRLESLGQLAGGVAHDFNNLLSVILNYASFVGEELAIAAEEPDGARWRAVREDVEQVQLAADRAAKLTHQLLAFARRDVAQPKVLNINDVVSGLEPMLHRTLGEQVQLVTSLAADPWPVMIDPGQLEQVLVNLAINARDAMAGGGGLTIDTQNTDVDATFASTRPDLATGRYVRLRVSDTGSGMDEATVQQAFEPFFSTKPKGEGTGLGLATVYGVITQAGGHVRIYSEAGRGTTVTVLLPATAATAGALKSETPGLQLGGNETVLVVEDEAALLEVTKRLLQRNGYTVLAASGSADALKLAGEHDGEIDMLITDVIMPELMGRELAQQVVRLRPDIRVLYISGYAQPVLARQGTLDPGLALVEKPFTEVQLLTSMRQVLQHP